MNVLHLDEQRGWRGGEQQASWLIQGLMDQGHTIAIAGRPDGEFLGSDHGGKNPERIPLPFRSELDLWTAWRLAREIKRRAIDIVHAHTSHTHMIGSVARALAGRCKLVVSRRVSFPPRANGLNRWKYSLPDTFISVSEKVDESLREYGVEGCQLEVVHSSVDVARLDVEPIPRAELGVPEGAPLLVNAGALVGHKDQETLVLAMAEVLKQIPEARLAVAGEGELRPRIEACIADLKIGDSVALLGHRNDAPRIIRAADLYVSSSWSEGLGTSVLEALACRVPVVATVAGGVPEMVFDGETGYLVPNRNPGVLAEAIVKSLRDPDNARAMAAKGRRLVDDKFGVSRMVEETLKVYEKTLGGYAQ